MAAISFTSHGKLNNWDKWSKLQESIINSNFSNIVNVYERYSFISTSYRSQEDKNLLLRSLIQRNLSGLDDAEIRRKCIEELKLISCIVDAAGDEDIAFSNITKFYSYSKQKNILNTLHHINDLFHLFRNRHHCFLGKQVLNRTAAKYIEALRQIAGNDLTKLNKHEMANINFARRESNKWYRANYIQNVKVERDHEKFIVQLGRKNGTMGDKNVLDDNRELLNLINALNKFNYSLYVKERIVTAFKNKQEVLDLSNCGLTKIPSVEIFAFFPFLSKLDLSINHISEIPANGFIGLTYLREIILDANEIKKIEEMAFNGLECIQTISLEGNFVEEIHKEKNYGGILGRIISSDRLRPCYFNELGPDRSIQWWLARGYSIKVHEFMIIDHYIRNSKNKEILSEDAKICEEYCLGLLKCNRLTDPEAIKQLAMRIYTGGIELNKVNQKLDWYANLFAKYGLKLLPFLNKNFSKWNAQDICSILFNYQLIYLPTHSEIKKSFEESIKAQLLSFWEGLNKNGDFHLLWLRIVLPYLQFDINKLAKQRIKNAIRIIFANAELVVDRILINQLIAQISSKSGNRNRQIKNIIEQLADKDKEKLRKVVDEIYKINSGTILQNIVTDLANDIFIPEVYHKEFYSIIEPFISWNSAFKKFKDTKLQEIARKVKLARNRFKYSKDVYSQYILSILPFLSYKDVLEILSSDMVTLLCQEQLSLVKNYCVRHYIEETDESPLNLMVIKRYPEFILLEIGDLLDLDAANIQELNLDRFKLITLTESKPDSEKITLYNTAKINLPLYLSRLIKSKLTVANTVASLTHEAIIKFAKFNGSELSTNHKDQLQEICYLAAQNPGQEIKVSVAFKKELMSLFNDNGLLDGELNGKPAGAFNQLMLYLSQMQEKIANMDKKRAQLPLLVVARAKKFEFYQIIADLNEVLYQELSKYSSIKEYITRYETAYILGIYFINLSSINVMGYEQGNINTSFNWFRLLSGIYFALSITDEACSWSLNEKKAVIQELNQILMDNECAGQITNKMYGVYVVSPLHKLYKRVETILNSIITE